MALRNRKSCMPEAMTTIHVRLSAALYSDDFALSNQSQWCLIPKSRQIKNTELHFILYTFILVDLGCMSRFAFVPYFAF